MSRPVSWLKAQAEDHKFDGLSNDWASFMQMLEMPKSSKNCNLKRLILSCNNVTWMYMHRSLLTAALVTSKLKGLHLGGCRSVTSFGWQLPSACLHDNSCVLEVLDLRCNSINENRWLQLGVHYVAILI